MRFQTKIYLILIVFLSLSNFFVWKEILARDYYLKVIFFEVGEGDSIFIETPQGHQILIDGGPSGKKILSKLAQQLPFWDRVLDLVILTHPDYDHLAGLNYVLKRYKVENILWTGVKKETKTFKRWQDNLKKEKAKILIAKKGQKIRAADLSFLVLYPQQTLEGGFFKKRTNDTSIVLKASFFGTDFLFPGDITQRVEKKLLREELESEILKVPHHGSKTSSSKDFLGQVSPEVAVISSGADNHYGHPHQEVLQRLKQFNIKVLRTDHQGDIKILVNPFHYWIQ